MIVFNMFNTFKTIFILLTVNCSINSFYYSCVKKNRQIAKITKINNWMSLIILKSILNWLLFVWLQPRQRSSLDACTLQTVFNFKNALKCYLYVDQWRCLCFWMLACCFFTGCCAVINLSVRLLCFSFVYGFSFTPVSLCVSMRRSSVVVFPDQLI